MALKNFKFGFGDGFQEVALPEEHILQVIEGNQSEKITDVKAAVLKAMREPVNSKPLQQCVNKGEKVAIVVSDITRLVHTDQILIHIVNELNLAGIPDEDISIVVAQGTHRPQTHEEDVIVCGQEVVDRIKIYQHSSKESVCVHVGDTPRGVPVWIDKHVTDADKVILTGGITVHLLAGYGGGRKSILPALPVKKPFRSTTLWHLPMNLAAACIPAFALLISKAIASTKNFALPANLLTLAFW